jgi:hypothetical protein
MYNMQQRSWSWTQPTKCTEISADIRLQEDSGFSYFFAVPAGLFLPLAASAFWCRSFRRCWARVLGHSPMCRMTWARETSALQQCRSGRSVFVTLWKGR